MTDMHPSAAIGPVPIPPRPEVQARTLIIQSYRTHEVSAWLTRCMSTVRDWAAQQACDYEFVDDRLFDVVPAWYRERCGRQRLPVTDLARLLLLREALTVRDYDCAVWMDADLLIFDADGFSLDAVPAYAFAREVWMARDRAGSLVRALGVNNSVLVMRRGNPVLDFLIHACEAVVARRDPATLEHNAVGTVLLSALARVMPLPVVRGAGLASPALVLELARGQASTGERHHADVELLHAFCRDSGEPLAVLNLCASLVNVPVHGVRMLESDLVSAMDVLLATRGEVINRHRGAG